jgi:chemotaxis methyl-accepting protein methylase
MNDDQFRQLLNRFGLSWKGYRKVRKGVKKRLLRQMEEVGCRSVKTYVSLLEKDPEVRKACERLMTVSISRFFRDKNLWQSLQEEILPGMMRNNRGKVMAWSAGCAQGEEVYSFKILWQVLEKGFGPGGALELRASDVNENCLQRAQAGIYPPSSLKEVPQRWREVFFENDQRGRRYAVASYLKEGIIWKRENLFLGPRERGFQIIFLRNSILTYYEDKIKVPAIRRIVHSLAGGGFLIIGAHEKLPPRVGPLMAWRGHPSIFQKKGRRGIGQG